MYIESYPLPRLKMWSTCCSITITADVSTLPLVTSHERDTSLKSVWVFLVYKLHQLSKWVVMCFTWVIRYNLYYNLLQLYSESIVHANWSPCPWYLLCIELIHLLLCILCILLHVRFHVSQRIVHYFHFQVVAYQKLTLVAILCGKTVSARAMPHVHPSIPHLCRPYSNLLQIAAEEDSDRFAATLAQMTPFLEKQHNLGLAKQVACV